MFSLLLNIWGWLISKVYPILTFQGLIHSQLYVWDLRNTEEFEANVASNHQCWKWFTSCPANFRNVSQIFLRLRFQKNAQDIFVHMGFTLFSVIITGSCLLIHFRTPLKITFVFFQRAHIHHLTISLFCTPLQRRKNISFPISTWLLWRLLRGLLLKVLSHYLPAVIT